MYELGGSGHILACPSANSIMQPRIYTYKITFEEVPHWYWGVHKEKKFGESYLGSPVTHKWMWEFYTPKIQILEFFPCTEEGWEEARKVEGRIVLQDLNNTLCLNENCGGTPSLSALRRGGALAKELCLGIFAYGNTNQRAGGLATLERKIGIYSPEFRNGPAYKENVRKGGIALRDMGLGIFEISPEEKRKNSIEGAKTTNSLRYRCTVTGKVLPPGPLACWQRARGIDPANRERL